MKWSVAVNGTLEVKNAEIQLFIEANCKTRDTLLHADLYRYQHQSRLWFLPSEDERTFHEDIGAYHRT